jgi:hypothetical protein
VPLERERPSAGVILAMRLRHQGLPPNSIAIVMRVAPASTLFSTSSLTTAAGRSTTSPAAIWFASSGGRR